MKESSILLIVLFVLTAVLLLPVDLFASLNKMVLRQPTVNQRRHVDIRSFLFTIAQEYNFSLITANNINTPIREIKGDTVAQALSAYLHPAGLDYRFFDNTLYVANKYDLERFFRLLPEYELLLPTGRGNKKVNGSFRSVDLITLSAIIRAVSGIEIRPASSLRVNLMMRLDNVPWKRLVIAIVFLNRYRMTLSDFTVVISPEEF